MPPCQRCPWCFSRSQLRVSSGRCSYTSCLMIRVNLFTKMLEQVRRAVVRNEEPSAKCCAGWNAEGGEAILNIPLTAMSEVHPARWRLCRRNSSVIWRTSGLCFYLLWYCCFVKVILYASLYSQSTPRCRFMAGLDTRWRSCIWRLYRSTWRESTVNEDASVEKNCLYVETLRWMTACESTLKISQ